ncbi:anti-sigma factor family protein, partial [Kaarinaea lacus]
MSTNNHPIEEFDLHAYVDGQLDAQRREQVEQWLKDHPEEARRVQQYQQQNQAMQALFDPVLAESVPETLDAQANRSRPNRQSQTTILSPLRVAAMIGFMMVGGILGYTVHDLAPVTGPDMDRHQVVASLSHQAAIAHVVYTPEVLHPVE